IEEEEMWEFRKALLEMKGEAPRNERFAEKFREIDQAIMGELEGTFEELGAGEPGKAAELVASCIEGAVDRKVSTGDRDGLEQMKEEIKKVAETYAGGGIP
ncbi:MAG: hypothetical protein ABEJ66_02770, partial [Candidatus Nanohaloarchaea archaeon]